MTPKELAQHKTAARQLRGVPVFNPLKRNKLPKPLHKVGSDHVIDHATPLIVIAASSAARLLEAEVIHMQYLYTQQPGYTVRSEPDNHPARHTLSN